MPTDESADDGDEEWRFSVDDFEDPPPDGDASTQTTAHHTNERGERPPDADEPNDDATVAGEFSPNVPVVAEMPDLESAVFVTLGVILTMIALAALVVGPSFGTFDALTVALVVAAVGALAYAVLVRLTPDT